MNKAKLLFALFSMLSALAPARALAQGCELPHERLLTRCGGEYRDVANEESTPESLSALNKSNQNLKQLIADYRLRAEQASEVVKQAQKSQ